MSVSVELHLGDCLEVMRTLDAGECFGLHYRSAIRHQLQPKPEYSKGMGQQDLRG